MHIDWNVGAFSNVVKATVSSSPEIYAGDMIGKSSKGKYVNQKKSSLCFLKHTCKIIVRKLFNCRLSFLYWGVGEDFGGLAAIIDDWYDVGVFKALAKNA